MISRQTSCIAGACTSALLLLLLPTTPLARTNKVTTGISTSYDYSDRQSEPVTAIPTNTSEDDYNRLAIQPLFILVSDSQQDHFEFRAAPSLKYDLLGHQTDWDNDLFLSAERSLSKVWQLRASNAFLQSDYHDSQIEGVVDPGIQDSQDSTPRLSADAGRTRYWRNTLKAGSTYFYGKESLVDLGADFILLRNDASEEIDSYEDYDRNAFHVKNEHRFNTIWKTIAGLSLIRGDYETSSDLKEYHLLATVENDYFRYNKLSLNYNYIASRYDEIERDNGDIHQSRLTWRRDFSQRLNTTVGAGPSYEKSEGRDANWGANGIAEINYLIQHGTFTFAVEKRYDVDNFSGTDERGFIDYWDTRFLFNYQLTDHLTTNARISYRYEDRESPALPATYHKDLITSGLGLHYSFLQYYSAGLNYTFIKQESDRIGDDYDDHRLLLSLSWKQEWLKW